MYIISCLLIWAQSTKSLVHLAEVRFIQAYIDRCEVDIQRKNFGFS